MMLSDADHAKPWVYLEDPKCIFMQPIKWDGSQIVQLSPHIPKGTVEVKLCAYSRCGAGNQDEDFKITLKNVGQPDFRHWNFGHGYSQNAWSYGTENFIAPVSSEQSLSLTVDTKLSGFSAFQLFLAGYR